jgi:hypothetical protein
LRHGGGPIIDITVEPPRWEIQAKDLSESATSVEQLLQRIGHPGSTKQAAMSVRDHTAPKHLKTNSGRGRVGLRSNQSMEKKKRGGNNVSSNEYLWSTRLFSTICDSSDEAEWVYVQARRHKAGSWTGRMYRSHRIRRFWNGPHDPVVSVPAC